MSWKNEVYLIVKQICPIGGMFNISDVYKYKDHFETLYSRNNHIEDKIRQTLQYLRDDGIIKFSDNNGNYRLLK